VQALIFANGRTHDGPVPRRILAETTDALVIAADGGVRVAQDYAVPVQVVIGDMDSVDEGALDRLRAAGTEILRYPVEKDETDLELALLWAREQGASWIRIFGGMGGRLDQTLANIYLLALPQLRDCDVRLVSHAQEAWLLYPGRHEIRGAAGDTVSLLPFNGAVEAVQTENLYYPLVNETLVFGPARGISNVMESDEAVISFRAGLLLVVHTVGKA
jgi:thiamine pyrophosphokinase